MKETLIVVVLIIPAITTVAVLGTILLFLDNNVSQHAFAQTNTTSAATNNMTVAESGNITAPIVPQGTSLNATSSQQPTGGAGGGGTSNQTQQQQQQGQANETRSPQQSEAGSGAQSQLPSAQQISGPITAAEGGEPFGGQEMGTVSIDSTGRRTIVSADINDMPEEGNVFEGWLVDTGGSEYKLSLGQFRNGTLDFSQYMVNPYTYKNFEVTEEPAEDPDPNAADSIAGFELQDPFGQ
ncbi:MAG TPA: hypothetical protein VJ799_07265 [Nitrososphaeraceae archaeon]|nr:hypothetical protein [Nitrososphaeraceae archaeon]